jgi:hypothetical protein
MVKGMKNERKSGRKEKRAGKCNRECEGDKREWECEIELELRENR